MNSKQESKELLSKTSAVARHRNCLWRALLLPLVSAGRGRAALHT